VSTIVMPESTITCQCSSYGGGLMDRGIVRLVRQIACLGDLVGQIRRRRLGQRGDETQRACLGDSRDRLGLGFESLQLVTLR
jgi:hypothetical protein